MVTYQTDPNKVCKPFVANASAYFGYSDGCLSFARWDELHEFFNKTGAVVVFGLNALNGRITLADGSLGGPWNHTNAESLIRYTAKKGYTMLGWEFGNELSGEGVGTRIHAAQYAEDVIKLKSLVDQIYQDIPDEPLLIAPAGFYEENWYGEFIDLTKSSSSVNVISHHLYSLGSGKDEHLVRNILDPFYLDGVSWTLSNLSALIKRTGTSAAAWVGEAGGAYGGGRHLVTDSFVSSFWYLDQLALSSKYGTKTYCRQSLIGECYGLLDTNTFKPNPDYYSALLWHKLMGPKVLSVNFNGTNKIRAYAHCAKHSKGITLLLLNLDQTIGAQVEVSSKATNSSNSGHLMESTREDYHLTAADGNLYSQTVLLNGEALLLNFFDEIPALKPIKVDSSQPINVAPLSIVFVHLPSFRAPACL
ncbi:hypothetical protein HPP92_016468 [Vanilla planifolia]|uniref:Heparanase-like protein 3 n=1 Tax=Vanilla planifolia TaxID=51239 RepID=A0A835US37_VANPL|nr:hypothetical protein HPP92_016468 [Vanilla planifolia]